MKSERGILLVVLLLAAAGVALYRTSVYKQPTPGPKPNLVVITGGSGPYWQAIAEGAQAAARDLDVQVDVRMPEHDEDLEAQASIVAGIDKQKVDGVAISPLDAEAQTRLIDRLAQDAFVVTVDSDAPLSARLSYVGASNRAAGIRCAELTKEALPDGGKVAVLLANLSKDNMLERQAGFQQELIGDDGGDEPALANDKYEIVDFKVDEGDNDRCAKQIRELLADHSDLAGIVGMNARHGPILLRVLQEAGQLGNIKLVTFDTPDETLTGIENGNVYATVAQDPYQYGYEAVRLLASFCQRAAQELPPPGHYSTMNISTKLIRQQDVEAFRKSLEQRTTKPAPAGDDKKAA